MFDPAEPEILLYVRDGDGWRLVAVEYAVPRCVECHQVAGVDPILATPIQLTDDEFQQLVDFVRNGLLDKRAKPDKLNRLIPKSVPSAFPVLSFQ